VVECGETEAVLEHPSDSYTARLLADVPKVLVA
jgi:ABC-type microcin C transport system duplicated ATPase subunit YejF